MRFHADHRFPAPPAEVAALLVDAGFCASLRLPDVGPAEIVRHAAPGAPGGAEIVLRYEYTGHLDPLARRLLGAVRLTWTQELHFEPVVADTSASVHGTLEMHADAHPTLMHGRADLVLEPEGARGEDGARGTHRTIDGELVVGLFGVGAMAERRIVEGLLARLDAEAVAVTERLGGG